MKEGRSHEDREGIGEKKGSVRRREREKGGRDERRMQGRFGKREGQVRNGRQ